jgi:hypothetical protein
VTIYLNSAIVGRLVISIAIMYGEKSVQIKKPVLFL